MRSQISPVPPVMPTPKPGDRPPRKPQPKPKEKRMKWTRDTGEAFSYADDCEVLDLRGSEADDGLCYAVIGRFADVGFQWEIVLGGPSPVAHGLTSTALEAKAAVERELKKITEQTGWEF